MVSEPPSLLQASFPKKVASASFFQILSTESEAASRYVFEHLSKNQRVAWLRSSWEIYAPLLWSWASEKSILLSGIQTPAAQKRRIFWQELYQSQSFEVWVIDQLPLSSAEGFFLRSLVSSSRLQLIFIQRKQLSFCQKRLQIRPSHLHTRVEWLKGERPHVSFEKASYRQFSFEEMPCLP
jgi:hypothetical protein